MNIGMRRVARPLLYLGIVSVVFGLAKIHASFIGHYDFTGSFRFAWEIAYAAVLVVAAYGAGLPDLPRTRRQALTSVAVAPATAALCMSAVQLLLGDALLPRFVVFGSAVLLVPWALACVAVASGGRVRDEGRDRVVVVGGPGVADSLRDELDGTPERSASVVGSLAIADARADVPPGRPLCEMVVSRRASVVVLDRAAQAEPSIVSQAAALHEAGIRVRSLSLFYDQWLGKLPIDELERVSLMFDIGEVHGAAYGRVKRLGDVCLALVGTVGLGVLLPFAVIGNRIGNRGPLFYRQTRVGKGGRKFSILKLRTMTPLGEGGLANEWTAENDPRITKFGRILRVTHLDELPQVVNILRGDLSVVGPRPEQPQYVEELVQKLPFYDLRHLVRPGLTGWAQVKYGYAGDEEGALEKLQYEFWYLGHQGLRLDARIVGRTVRSVIGSEAAGR